MKLLAVPAILAGLLLSLLALRVLHSNWNDFGTIGLYTLGANAFTGLMAFAVFRGKKEGAGVAKGLLVAGYLVGIGIGAYFYYS
jgi:hypothetical protein